MRIVSQILGLLVLVAVVAGPASAEKSKISFALGYGTFMPTDSVTKDQFDDNWTRISFTTFEPEKPASWRFIFEGGAYNLDSATDVSLYPITFGFERGFGESSNSVRPYVVLRAGPYYGQIENAALGLDEDHVGLNSNLSLGLVFNRKYYLEARYDYFSELADYDFSGFSINAGMKLFSLDL
ncbi:MAG: hypothetical protein ABFD49_10095 [Armatimonadota bacterium]|nr:hypothetical protein [bacterium]